MTIKHPLRTAALGTTCAVLGLGAGSLLTASAATHTTHTAKSAKSAKAHGKRQGAVARRLLGRAVHADLTVAEPGGTFGTATIDRGSVTSVSGQELAMDEGTRKSSFKHLTLTLPTTARVRIDGTAATLGDLKAGQRVVVVQAPKRTVVLAHTAKP